MKIKKAIDVIELFRNVLGDKINDFIVPPPIFEVMQGEIIEYNEEEKSLIVRLPVLEKWQNPFGTMQGGMIDTAIDNAVGPLSLLVAPMNMTRSIETKILRAITMDVETIYVKAKLVEVKKRRLIFEAEVVDVVGLVYATSTIVNYIVRDEDNQ